MAMNIADVFIQFSAQGVSKVATEVAGITTTANTATTALAGVESGIVGIGSKAQQIEGRLRAAVAEMQRLSAIKLAGGGGPDIDAQLSRARGAVGGLSASLARFTGRSVADVAASVGLLGDKSSEAMRKTDGLAASIAKMRSSGGGAGWFSSIGSAAGSAVGMLTSFKAALLGAGVAASAFAAINMVGEMEQTSIAFEVMLGDADKAQVTLGQLRAFADESPFTFPGVTQASRTLLQFGVDASQVVPTIKRIGDVAAGDEQKMASLSLAFGQMSATGRLMGQDLLQMVNAGFNPLQEMARSQVAERLGIGMVELDTRIKNGTVSLSEINAEMPKLKARMEAGCISAAEVAKAFETVTSAGGKFHGMTDRMSKSTLGLFSTLKDNVGTVVRGMTEPFMLGVNSVIAIVGGLAKNVGTLLAPAFRVLGVAFSDFMGGMNLDFDAAGMGQSLARMASSAIASFRSISAFVAGIDFSGVSEVISDLGEIVSITFASITELLSAGADGVMSWKATIFDAFGAVGSFVGETVDTVAFAFRNWGTLHDIAEAETGLFVDNQIAKLKAFVVNVGMMGEWIGNNWINAFKDMATGTATILSNIGSNLSQFMQQVKSWLRGDGFNFRITPLTEGFTSSMQKLPDFVKPRVQETTADISALYRKLGEDEAAYEKRKQDAKNKPAAKPNEFEGPIQDAAVAAGSSPLIPPVPEAEAKEKASKAATIFAFDALAARQGDSPMVKQQETTNTLLGEILNEVTDSGEVQVMDIIEGRRIGGGDENEVVGFGMREVMDIAEGRPIGGMLDPKPQTEAEAEAARRQAGWQKAYDAADPNMRKLMDEKRRQDDAAAGIGPTAALGNNQAQSTLEQQLTAMSMTVKALQELVGLASTTGIKTKGGEMVLA